MSEFVPVCKVEDVPVGEARQFKVNGTEIALARVQDGECYAIGGRCTHLRAQLGKGELEGTVLTCPWHGSQFEVTTGKLVRWVQEPLVIRIFAALIPPFLRRGVPSYEVKVEDGQVLVKI
ncbi:MAG: Rieske 2Fe-2S domain-containing protein [Chloroflexi bacterium]|nr:Rieske 2Fe-2S domain-containing protein [Chloroflexota bacterium]